MNQHARNIEPDLGSLLDMTEDLSDQEMLEDGKTEPRFGGEGKGKPGMKLGPMDRIGPEAPQAPRRSSRHGVEAAPPLPAGSDIWGGFWRAVVIGVVSGTVGGLVGAFTLVWLTGDGWSVFAKLLVDAIGHL